jgi:hypothetical protein
MTEYNGSVYVGVVGPTNEPGAARDSIQSIGLRQGDIGPIFARATKGYEARQMHINKFLDSRADFILLLDHDMIFPPDTLERLRAHKLPYVSGLYMRRQYNPVVPIWFKPFDGRWPISPWTGRIERGKLYKIGASGWGCVLVHRSVVLAVRALLKGEQEILEDDMDVYPYDLSRMLSTIRNLRKLAEERPAASTLYPALEYHIGILEQEFRPLRCDNEPIGSDIRFPFFALKAGYQFYGDPDVSCSHILDYPLSPSDFESFPPEIMTQMAENVDKRIRKDRARMYAQWQAVHNG